MVRKKQHNDGLVDGNIHSKKRPSTTKFQYPKNMKPVGILYGWIFNVNTLFVKTIFSVKKLLHALTRSIEICHPKDLLMNMQFGNYRNICKICGCGSLY